MRSSDSSTVLAWLALLDAEGRKLSARLERMEVAVSARLQERFGSATAQPDIKGYSRDAFPAGPAD